MAAESKIWIGQKGEKFGPYSEENVRQWISEGKFAPDAMAWRAGMASWVPLADFLPSTATAEEPPSPPPANHPPFVQASAADARAAAMSEAFAGRRPGQPDTLGKERWNLPNPPALHWGLVLLFTILTFGIFGIIWQFIQANWVQKIDRLSNASLQLGGAVACAVIGQILCFMGGTAAGNHTPGAGLVAVGILLVLASWVLQLVAYFSMAGSMRRSLATYGVELWTSSVTLFFFQIFYLQSHLSWVSRWKQTGKTSPKVSEGVFWALYLMIPVIAIVVALTVPAYQDYLIRTQVSEGAVLTDGAKTAVAEYYSNSGQFPLDNSHAGLPPSKSITGKYVSSVDVSGRDIAVAFDTPNSNSDIRDKLLVLVAITADGNVIWDCRQSTVPRKYLPVSCR